MPLHRRIDSTMLREALRRAERVAGSMDYPELPETQLHYRGRLMAVLSTMQAVAEHADSVPQSAEAGYHGVYFTDWWPPLPAPETPRERSSRRRAEQAEQLLHRWAGGKWKHGRPDGSLLRYALRWEAWRLWQRLRTVVARPARAVAAGWRRAQHARMARKYREKVDVS